MTDLSQLVQDCQSGSNPSACSDPDVQAISACQSGSDASACSNPAVQAYLSSQAGGSSPSVSADYVSFVQQELSSMTVQVVPVFIVLLTISIFIFAHKKIERLIK